MLQSTHRVNLRPTSSGENNSKGSKTIHSLMLQEIKAKYFSKLNERSNEDFV